MRDYVINYRADVSISVRADDDVSVSGVAHELLGLLKMRELLRDRASFKVVSTREIHPIVREEVEFEYKKPEFPLVKVEQ